MVIQKMTGNFPAEKYLFEVINHVLNVALNVFKVNSKVNNLKHVLTILTLSSSCISESCIKIKINLNFYFHTLWCLKRFYEGLKRLHKTF